MNYFRSKLPVYDTGIDTYIKVFCILFLTLSKVYKTTLNIAIGDNLQSALVCLSLALIYLMLVILHSLGAFLYITIQDMIVMLFILVYNDAIRRASHRMMKIAMESMEILIVFASVLLAFACLARILFFGTLALISDFEELYESKYSYAAYNYETFTQSFYSMVVGVSTTNYPMSLVKAYSASRLSAIFYILNTFILNIIMFNLILATFYFYYQNFYTESVKKLNTKLGLV